MMKPDNLMSDKVICRGIVSPVLGHVSFHSLSLSLRGVVTHAAASGCGEANEGRVNRYVFSGFA
jgi:hypothetical protein